MYLLLPVDPLLIERLHQPVLPTEDLSTKLYLGHVLLRTRVGIALATQRRLIDGDIDVTALTDPVGQQRAHDETSTREETEVHREEKRYVQLASHVGLRVYSKSLVPASCVVVDGVPLRFKSPTTPQADIDQKPLL